MMLRTLRSLACGLSVVLGAGLVAYSLWSPVTRADRTPLEAAGLVSSPAEVRLRVSGAETHQFPFELTNHHSSPATIISIRSTCGCTVVEQPAESTLQAGQSVSITAKANAPAFGTSDVSVLVEYRLSEGPPSLLTIPIHFEAPTLHVPYVMTAPKILTARSYGAERQRRRGFEIETRERGPQPWLEEILIDARGFEASIVSRSIVQDFGLEDVHCRYAIEVMGDIPEAVGESREGTLVLKGRVPAARPVAPIALQWTRAPALRCYPESVVIKGDHSKSADMANAVIRVDWQDSDSTPDWNGIRWEVPAVATAQWQTQDHGVSRHLLINLAEIAGEHFEIPFYRDGHSRAEVVVPVLVQAAETTTP